MEVRPNPAVSSSNDSLSSTNSTPSTVRSGTITRSRKSSSKAGSVKVEAKDSKKKSKEPSAFTPVRNSEPIRDSSKLTSNQAGGQRVGMWTKPAQNKTATGAFGPRVEIRDRPGVLSGAPVPSLDQSMNDSQESLRHDFLNSSRPKGYNWVNSYFRNKNHNRSDSSFDEQASCEQPELKTSIQPKQNSFLRKVQAMEPRTNAQWWRLQGAWRIEAVQSCFFATLSQMHRYFATLRLRSLHYTASAHSQLSGVASQLQH